MAYRRKICVVLLLSLLFLLPVSCGSAGNAPEEKAEPDFLEEVRPRQTALYCNYEDYEELNTKLMELLADEIKSGENYSCMITFSSSYRKDTEQGYLSYLWDVTYSLEAMPVEKRVKIEKLSDVLTEGEYNVTSDESGALPVKIIECVSETVLREEQFNDYIYYIDIGDAGVGIRWPRKQAEEIYDGEELALTFSELFFPENADVFAGIGEAAFKNPGSTHSVVKHFSNASRCYAPFFLILGKEVPEIPMTTLSFSYGATPTNRGLHDIIVFDTNYYGIVYPMMTGEEFSMMYSGAEYDRGTIKISRFDSSLGFELPK